MSRDEGFRIADVDVGLLDDPKVRALVRSTRDEGTVARCLVGYVGTVLSSWARGERVGLNDASPLWLTGLDELAEQLAGAGLLDASGRIPERAWASWFVPAKDRQEATRERWRRAAAGRRRGGRDADSESSPRGVQAESRAPSYPSVLSVLAVPTSPTSPSRNGAARAARQRAIEVDDV